MSIPMNKVKILPLSILFLVVVFGCHTKNNYNADKDTPKVTAPSAISTEIDAIHTEITAGNYGLIDRFMVIQNDEVLADFKYKQDYVAIAQNYGVSNDQEQYDFNNTDWHPYYKDSELHTLQSVTKSITSILVGMALDTNDAYNVNAQVMPLLKGYEDYFQDQRKRNISIEDLLTMRSGLLWNEETDHNDETNDCYLLESSENWIEYILGKPMDTAPGSSFVYNGGATVLLGKVLRTITGKRIDQWAEEQLFKPLGISDFYWKVTPDGEIDTEGGLYLKAEDLAKIGQLMLNKGQWNGQQIVSERWLTTSTSPVLKDIKPNWRKDMGYGYQWWVPEYTNTGKTKIYTANGYGGQYLMMVPAYNLILVFNGWKINEESEKSAWRVLQDRIIPAVEKG